MRSDIPEQLLAVIGSIDAHGHASLTRLAVLEKWFEHPGRSPAFGLWVARRAAGRKGRTKGEAGALLDEVRALLGPTSTLESFTRPVDRNMVRTLYRRARDLQSEFQQQQSGPVRIIHCWPLLLVEQGLALQLGEEDSPSAGYQLAADFCRHSAPRHRDSLCGPGRTKVMEIVRFMFNIEAIEDQPER